jgi:hypothetical protein
MATLSGQPQGGMSAVKRLWMLAQGFNLDLTLGLFESVRALRTSEREGAPRCGVSCLYRAGRTTAVATQV